MAEPEQAEEQVTETPEPVAEPVVEPAPVDEPEEKRPGGDTPEDIYRRKEYDRRVKAEKAAEEVRLENARLAERVKLLEEQKSKPAEQKIYTIAEVNAFVAAEKITREDADRYIDEVIIPAKIDQRLRVHDTEQQKKAPVERAKAEVAEYLELHAALRDKNSDDFRKVATKYSELVARGHPADERTESVAAEMVLGTIDAIKKKQQMATLSRQSPRIPTDAGGGGQGSNNGKIDISKASAEQKAFWDQMRTSPEDRVKEYKYILDKQGRK